MARFGFVGGTYSSESVLADCQRCMNLYPEAVESGMGKASYVMYPTPGHTLFAALPGRSVRGELAINGRFFAVAGTTLYEVSSKGLVTVWGQNLPDDGNMASLAASAIQLLVASGGNIYVLQLVTTSSAAAGTFTQILANAQAGTGPVGPISQVQYTDGYFMALLTGTADVQLSNLNDATTWNDIYVSEVSVFPENLVSMIVAFREPILFGGSQAQAYYDSGNTNNPYQPVQGGIMEQGCIAQFSVAKLNNSVFWIGGDDRGAGIVWQANGYTPSRVSNHSIEYAMSTYATISDAVGYGYEEKGHTFYVLYFPTANATWVYDCATSLWHERGRWNGNQWEAWHAQCHAYVFGKHLVGDWASGNIYVSSISTATDNGKNIRRLRRAPHISSEQEWIYHREMQIDLEVGSGPIPPLPAPSTFPTFYPVLNSAGVIGALTALDNGDLNWQADPALTAVVGAGGVGTILVSDATGKAWAVSMTDGEQLDIAPSSGASQAYYLNDWATATSWKLTVLILNGEPQLTFTAVPYNAAYPAWILFGTTPSQNPARLQIVNAQINITGGTVPFCLNDTVLPNTSWELIVEAGGATPGVLTQTKINYNGSYPTAIDLATAPGQLNAVISIANGQLQQVQPYPSARDPQIMLRWSDDGGKTWGDEHWESAGQAGTYKTRCHWHRLGRSRDRVYEMVLDDPILWRVMDAYLDADPGFKPTERLNKNLAKMA